MVAGFVKSYKNQATKLQEILDEFFASFNDENGLNKNSTPLSNLLKGIRKTDAELVKKYIKKVSNAQVYLKDNGNYTLKLVGDELILNDVYGTIKWNDLAEHAIVIVPDHYKSMSEAIKATGKTLEKALKTVQSDEDRDDLIKTVKELLNI